MREKPIKRSLGLSVESPGGDAATSSSVLELELDGRVDARLIRDLNQLLAIFVRRKARQRKKEERRRPWDRG